MITRAHPPLDPVGVGSSAAAVHAAMGARAWALSRACWAGTSAPAGGAWSTVPHLGRRPRLIV